MNNKSLAEDMTQFIFKVSNFYSLASTLDAGNFDICSHWLEKARRFIAENNLLQSKQHAIWYNLIGGHKSREYQMGRNIDRPASCVENFKNAVCIHKEVLQSSLDNPKDVDLRHVQMCLASTLLQDAMWRVTYNGLITPDVKQSYLEASQYLAELTDTRLVLANGSPDLYRRAGCVQSLGYVQLLSGHFIDANKSMHRATELIRESIETTGATGQLSAILNDEANSLIALHTVSKNNAHLQAAKECLHESIRLSEGQFEQMYADLAKRSLSQLTIDVATHPATRLANAIMSSYTLTPMPKLNVVKTDVTAASMQEEVLDDKQTSKIESKKVFEM